ncbi:MAG TPA: glycosyltransferase family 4 protein [Steroidobacteraceae bacterium]|nr:glycosyltransferase family 4 protein [Steroidobacteraceae bacterium]
MRTALVLSRVFPLDERMVHGVFQRLGTQVEALARVADRIECLFLVSAHRAREFGSAEQLRAHEQRLQRRWTPKLSLRAAAVVQGIPTARWALYGAGVFDFHSQQLTVGVNNPAALAAVRDALRARPDLICAHRLGAMALLMRLADEIGDTPVFLDLDDIEHVALSRRLLHDPLWPMERLRLLQIPRLLLAEIQAIRRARRTFVCSEPDCRYLRRLACSSRVEVVRNGTCFPASIATGRSEPIVLFVGYLDYGPNALAADILVRDIWPLVHAQVPEATLMIAGRHPQRLKSYASAGPGVTFAGFVEDLAALYARVRVVCCPILDGGGTRVKIIEAAAHGRAVVSTPLGAEGLDLRDGEEILLRGGVAELAAACVTLLQDPEAATRLGLAARERARRTYEHGAAVEHLERLFREAADR